MSNDKSTDGGRHGMRMRDLVLLALLALLSVAARNMLRIPIRMPGHTYAVFIVLLVFACSYIGKRGAATFMGLVAGTFGIIGMTQEGFTVFPHFFLPALALEAYLLLPVPGPQLMKRILEGLVVGWSMVIAKSAVNLVTGQPFEVMLAKLGPGLVTHAIFGVVAGVLAFLMVRAVSTYTRQGRPE